MAKPNVDRRVERTKSALMHAFVQLFFEKPFSQITTIDIAARANVGRSTFYEHYQGKAALLAESFRRPLGPLMCLLDPDVVTAHITPALDHMWANRSRARVLQGRVARRAMVEVLAEAFEQRALSAHGATRRVIARAFAELVVGTLIAWLTGEISASTDTLAQVLIHSCRARDADVSPSGERDGS